MAKMLGKLGWFGPYSCPCCKRSNRAIRRLEDNQWRREART